jgi:ribosomal protein L37AE/L43A
MGRDQRRFERAMRELRARVARELRPEDQRLAEGPVFDPSIGADAYLVVAEDRFLMAYLTSELKSVMEVPFEKVVTPADQPGAMKLTTRGWFTPIVPIPGNPNDETDFYIYFGDQEQIKVALMDGLRRRSPYFEEWREGVARFKNVLRQPVSTWDVCPMCESAAIERVNHAFRCTLCGRYFADGSFRPDVSEQSDAYGKLLGTKPWALLETELDTAGNALVWFLRPREFTAGPIVLPDRNIEAMAQRGHTRL